MPGAVSEPTDERRKRIHAEHVQTDRDADEINRVALLRHVHRGHGHDGDHHHLRGKDRDDGSAREAIDAYLSENWRKLAAATLRRRVRLRSRVRQGRCVALRAEFVEEQERVWPQQHEDHEAGDRKTRCGNEKRCGKHGEAGRRADDRAGCAEVGPQY